MRALRHHTFGPPADVLQLDRLADPDAAPGTAVVRLSHRSINPADLLAVRGRYGALPALPAVAGHEGTGWVEAVGEGVDRSWMGRRVVPLGVDGTWRERVAVPAEDLFAVPEGVPETAAAQLFVNPLTAWLLLRHAALEHGDWLLQTAATSAVGRCVVQLARARGLRTVNLVRRPAPELEALGADVVLVTDGTDAAAVRQAVREQTGGGAGAAFDAVGGAVGALAASCLRPDATAFVYGVLSGQPIPLDVPPLLFGETAVRGVWRTRWFERAPRERVSEALGDLAAAVRTSVLTLPVEAEYDLSLWPQALAHAGQPRRTGKVLLVG